MVVRVTSNNEENPIKRKVLDSAQNIIHQFVRHSSEPNSEEGGGYGQNLLTHQSYIVALVTCTCKNIEDPFKNEGATVVITVIP